LPEEEKRGKPRGTGSIQSSSYCDALGTHGVAVENPKRKRKKRREVGRTVEHKKGSTGATLVLDQCYQSTASHRPRETRRQ